MRLLAFTRGSCLDVRRLTAAATREMLCALTPEEEAELLAGSAPPSWTQAAVFAAIRADTALYGAPVLQQPLAPATKRRAKDRAADLFFQGQTEAIKFGPKCNVCVGNFGGKR